MDIKELENRYKNMDTEELIRVVSTDRNDYKPEAVAVAEAELKKRNVYENKITEVSDRQKEEDKAEQEKIETTPLSKRTKFFFTIFPGLAFWYIIFRTTAPGGKYKYIQKERDSMLCFYKSISFYLIFSVTMGLLVYTGNILFHLPAILLLLIILLTTVWLLIILYKVS